MDKLFMPNETPESRLRILEAQATKVTKQKYFTRLSSDELTNARAAYTNNGLTIDRIEEEKKELLAQYKEQLKELKEIKKHLSKECNDGYREQEGKLFGFLDGNMMYFYDTKGELIETLTRPATVEELQNKTIFHDFARTGTDN